AVGVASLYLNQPLLVVMGKSFGQSERAMGFVAMATQVGYAVGIMSFVPLGDVVDRRKLMMRMFGGVSLALVLMAVAKNLTTAIIASVLIGMLASVTHIVLPMAPDLAKPGKRGQAIGTVMTGLLLGVLLARSFAGWVSHFSGWRLVFVLAALMNLAFVPLLYRVMPKAAVRERVSYKAIMQSVWRLFVEEPLLRESGLLAAFTFAAFSCFWTTLSFFLAKYYGMGPGVAGTFGVVGAAGAMVAPIAGKMADKRGVRFVVTVGGAIMACCYLWIWASVRLSASTAMHMVMLVVGVVILDSGMQMVQISNQTRVFGLGQDVRSRLNTLYMVMFFIGGAIGSGMASVAWSRWEWTGVCGLEMCFILGAGVVHATGYSRRHPSASSRHISSREIELV
ncbi:MAG: MFS transporter, partial [Bryocella sp.]